ncbi:hypothetical protein XylorDRAFT_0183 [Xylanibacter oryzae DSM 17970]|uniref:Uncharacterized protein n=1 Tax=Xylanibacter oryzae DSM 17970 TaxID=915438 RepID=A0ABN0RUC1_9BACT|nr:hypothetical protein XylorDRAFT_0183 [Xylanibacter oryzae DSM 17970]
MFWTFLADINKNVIKGISYISLTQYIADIVNRRLYALIILNRLDL